MSFRSLIEQFLGIRPPDPGQGLDWSFSTNFPRPLWLLVLAVLAVAVFVMQVYRRDAAALSRPARALLIALRWIVWACFLFFLSEAMLAVERTGLPHVVVMVDTSGSMATDDGDAGRPTTRLNLVRELLRSDDNDFLRRLLNRHKLRLYSVDAEEQALGPAEIIDTTGIDAALADLDQKQATGEQSRLGDGLRRMLANLRGSPPASVIYFTDGVVTDGEKLSAVARFARQKSVAVYPVAVGRQTPARDVELHDSLVDEVAFVDDPVSVAFKLTAQGLDGQSTQVRVRLLPAPAGKAGDSATPPQPIVEETRSLPSSGKTQRGEILFTPREVGDFELELEAVPLPNETNPRNNIEKRRLSVRKEKTRVLLVDRLPRWEFRELKALLEREKTVDLKVVLQEADPEFAREDRTALPEFPVRREALFEYDVLILGDINPAYFNSVVWDNLREFVRDKGGGLVLIAGREFTPWAWRNSPIEPLFPVDLATTERPAPASASSAADMYRPDPTAEGLRSVPFLRLADTDLANRQVWDKLPGWYGIAVSPDVKKGAQVLLSHSLRTGTTGKLPVITMQRFGAGKCVYHASDETWRWRFRTGDLYYGRYWVQLIRYLSRSKLLGRDRAAEIVADRQTYRSGDPATLRVRYLDDRAIPTEPNGTRILLERVGLATGQERRELTLARLPDTPMVFETQIAALAEGSYHAWISSPSLGETPPSLDFRVESPAREARVLQADYPELSQLARMTGGQLYPLNKAASLPRELPPGKAVPLETEEPIRLWNHWIIFSLLVTALSLEWLLRKRWQLA